ncbi:hypothetical protein KKB43_03295 [Patescibacteria group bacterium]|nr:hypothetical protein [Patescibacteria group bacterium]MBU4580020.1 hypothetical protein [Patescibacteria group bacterium]
MTMLAYENINIEVATAIWDKMAAFFLSLAMVFAIIIIGWIIAVIAGKIVKKILKAINVDSLLATGGLKEKFEKSGIKISLVKVGEDAAKWIIILLSITIATESVGLNQVSNFLNNILNYIPNIIIAVIILGIGILIAEFSYRIVSGSFKTAAFGSPKIFGEMAKWAIIIFALLIALDQLGLEMEFIKILFTGVVAMAALAGGIAFGLGGRDMAKGILDKTRERMR